MQNAKEFIKKHNMDHTSIDLNHEMGAYLDEMKRGLCGGGGSLLMIPSFVVLNGNVEREKPVICVDAGGTNLRIAVAGFRADGSFYTDGVSRYVMPGVEKEIEAQEFFDVLAGLILPFTEFARDIVISFAYPVVALPDTDCEIVRMTKEVKVRNAAGKRLGREVCASLEKQGAPGCKAIVINDSVATALAGMAENLDEGYGTFTGTILGTGSNSCYLEDIRNIAKICDESEGVMVINTEAGSYDKIPRSDIDIAFDNSLQNPGVGVFEKMTSGGYLGALCAFALRTAANEGVLIDARMPDSLSTAEVNEFLTDGSGVLAESFSNKTDREAAREILLNIVLRAGRLLALQMAAMAVKAHKENNRVCMVIEGTTYEKMYGLKKEALTTLLPYLSSMDIAADVISVDMAVLKGCAIAGLSRSIV